MKYMDLCVCCVHIHHRLQETLQTRIWQIHILTLQAGLHVRSPFPLLVPSSSLSQSWSSQLLLERALTLISAMLFCWSHADLLQLFIGEEELKIGVKELKKKEEWTLFFLVRMSGTTESLLLLWFLLQKELISLDLSGLVGAQWVSASLYFPVQSPLIQS